MGRVRKVNKHLPRRMYLKHGGYYFLTKDNRWEPLGRDYAKAIIGYSRFVDSAAGADGTVNALIDTYVREELVKRATRTQRNRLVEYKAVRKVFGDMRPQDIEPHHVWRFWRERGETVQAKHEVRALSAIMTYARQTGARTTDNPCFKLQMPEADSRDRYVTDDEFHLVRSVAQPMIAYAMDLAVQCGLDGATIRLLERRHLTEQGILFERPKTGEWQLIEWDDDLRITVDSLKRLRPELRRFLICTRQGKQYTLDGFQSQWQRTMRKALKAGLKQRFHFHDLRAKSASDADDDQSASDRLGHRDPAITRQVYRRKPRRARPLPAPKVSNISGSK